MLKQRTVLAAASALYDDTCDGQNDRDEYFRAVWVAAVVAYRPGMTTDELVHAVRPLIKKSTSV